MERLTSSMPRPALLAASLLAFLATSLSAGSTLAQTENEDTPAETELAETDSDERARELYLQGDRAYAEGRYEESITLFREAYDLSGRSQLLFNLANAYERAGQIEEAIAALRSYAPDAPAYDADTIARRIRALEARLEEQTAEAEPDGQTPVLDLRPPPEPEPASSESGGSALLPTGLVLIGLGAVAGGIGLGLGLAKQDASTELETLCMEGFCTDSARDVLDRESSMALGADISFIVAGALGLTGLILTIVGAASGDGDEEEQVAVVPFAAPGLGGLHVSANF